MGFEYKKKDEFSKLMDDLGVHNVDEIVTGDKATITKEEKTKDPFAKFLDPLEKTKTDPYLKFLEKTDEGKISK